MSKLYKLGVIGSPIDHSLSPFIHSRFARQENINIDYRAYKVEVEDLDNFVKDFFLLKESKGLNVTLPHKKSVATLVSNLSDEASFINAANTVYRNEGKLFASSTDGAGLINDLIEKNISLENKRILIIGAGAAVESVLYRIIKAKPKSITISNRTKEKAKRLQDKFSIMMPISTQSSNEEYDLVINGSSAGLTGGFSPPDISDFNDKTFFYDLNYSLTGTEFCNWSEEISSHTHDGMGMLVSQAALSFYEWFGVMPSTGDISKELLELRA